MSLRTAIRVLVVDDYAPFRLFVRLILQNLAELQIIGEASDGTEAVQKAEELRPDLILLDLELPTLNGIEAARRIQELSPTSKILFVSANRSWDIAQKALRSGSVGYAASRMPQGIYYPLSNRSLRASCLSAQVCQVSISLSIITR